MLEEFERVARTPGMREVGAAYVALRQAEQKMRNDERKFVKHLADAIETFVNSIEKKILETRKKDQREDDEDDDE